jgi:tetratricopeptide (TPR) repeat protein
VPTDQSILDLLSAGDEALVEAFYRTGDFTAAREILEQARAEADLADDAPGQARALDSLGMLAHYENITRLMTGSALDEGAIEAEEKLFRQALARWQAAGEQAGTARALFGLGLVFQVLREDWMTAMPYYWQALGLVSAPDAHADLYLRSEVHRHVGFYFLHEDVQPSEAVRHLQLSLDLREELGDPRRVPTAAIALAQAELAAESQDRAIELLTRAVTEAHAAGLSAQQVERAEQALRDATARLEPDAPAASDAAEGEESVRQPAAGEGRPGGSADEMPQDPRA